MRTALDAPDSALDEHERKFVGIIREHGWHRMNVLAGDDGPGFTYTTGLWLTLGVPELIVFDLKFETAGAILFDFVREARAGRSFPVGKPFPDLFGNDAPASLAPVAVEHYPAYLGWSRWFYGGDDFPCRQLIWPDRHGLFPWKQGFDAVLKDLQPDLSPLGWRKTFGEPESET